MEDNACRRFFLEPEQTLHRRYEALRAFFVEGQSLEATAARFGYLLHGEGAFSPIATAPRFTDGNARGGNVDDQRFDFIPIKPD